MNTSPSRGVTTSPPPINWATRPNRRPPDSVNTPQNHVEESGAAHVDTSHIGDLQETLRRLSSPRRRQLKVRFQDNPNNVRMPFIEANRNLIHQNESSTIILASMGAMILASMGVNCPLRLMTLRLLFRTSRLQPTLLQTIQSICQVLQLPRHMVQLNDLLQSRRRSHRL